MTNGSSNGWMEKDYHNLPIKFTSFIFQQVRVRSHLATTTWIFHVVTLTFDVVRNMLHGYQCYCLHITTEKSCNKHIVVGP